MKRALTCLAAMGIAGGMALSAATRTWIGGTGAGTLLVRKGSGSVLLFR